MDLLEIMQGRRSIRSYTGEAIAPEKLEAVLKAGLLAPTGRNLKSAEMILVTDRDTLRALSVCKERGGQFLSDAAAAVVTVGHKTGQDIWVEDCSIAMSYMQLEAAALGIGSCWVQFRMRRDAEGNFADGNVRKILNIPDEYEVEAILALGIPAAAAEARAADPCDIRIHREHF